VRDENGRSKEFGFVCYEKPSEAVKAITELHEFNGMYVVEAKSKEKRQEEIKKNTFNFKKSMSLVNLIVKGLNAETTNEEHIIQHFSEFGAVKSVKILADKTRAFVTFFDREPARNAKEHAAQKFLNGNKIYVNFVIPKEVRAANIEETMDRSSYENVKKQQLMKENIPNTNFTFGQVL
jgi:polyadenylate-binding protein